MRSQNTSKYIIKIDQILIYYCTKTSIKNYFWRCSYFPSAGRMWCITDLNKFPLGVTVTIGDIVDRDGWRSIAVSINVIQGPKLKKKNNNLIII